MRPPDKRRAPGQGLSKDHDSTTTVGIVAPNPAAADGYQGITRASLITDASETPQRLSTTDGCQSITGLSKVQRKILGLAYTVSEYRRRVEGVPLDYVTPIGIFQTWRGGDGWGYCAWPVISEDFDALRTINHVEVRAAA